MPPPRRPRRIIRRRRPRTWAQLARQLLVFVFRIMRWVVQTVQAVARYVIARFLATKAYLLALCCKSPDEFARDMHARLASHGMKARIVTIDGCDDDSFKTEYIRMPRRTKEQENRLLVKLHRDMDHLWLDSFVWAYVEYQDNKIDLRPLQNKWNLENIFAVDCERRQVFEWPGQYGVLSGHAVRLLTNNQDWLRVIERPSQATLRGRKSRLELLDTKCSLRSVTRQFVKPGWSFIDGFMRGKANQLDR